MTVNRSDFIGRARRVRVGADADVILFDPSDPNSEPYVAQVTHLTQSTAAGGVVIPPATAAIYWESLATWYGANYAAGVRFDVAAGRVVSQAKLPCTVASGNIEVSVHRVVPDGDGGFIGLRVATSGVIACPSPSSGSITVALPRTFLPQGQYVTQLWCDNETAEFMHNLSTGVLRAGIAMSVVGENAEGVPALCALEYSGRAVAIVLEERTVEIATVVLLGDSITEQQPWFAAGAGLANLAFDVTERGTPGQTSAQIAARVQADVIGDSPDVCMLLAGTNDVGTSAPTSAAIITNLATIIDACTAAGIAVVIGTIPPRFNTDVDDPLTSVQRAALVETNAWIMEQDNGVSVRAVNWSAEMSTGDSITPNTALFTDHVHPNAAGALVMAQVLAARIG